MKDKKGQLNGLAAGIIALIVAAVILVMGIIVSQEITNTQDAAIDGSIANESLAAFAGTTASQEVGGSESCGFGTIDTSSVVVFNETKDIQIAAGNYTVFSNGSIVNATADESMYAWQISYDYSWGGEACDAGNKTVVGLGSFADFWNLIVLAIVISVVIALLLVVFGGRKSR